MSSLPGQVSEALALAAIRDSLGEEAMDRASKEVRRWALTRPQDTGVRRFQRLARAAYAAASLVVSENLARQAGVPTWTLDPLGEDTPALRRIVRDIESNVRDYLVGDRTDKDLRRLVLRVRYSVQAAVYRGHTDTLQSAASLLPEVGLVPRLFWRANFTDNTPCPECTLLHGQEVSAGEAFPRGRADHFGTFSGPPAHPNCRCVLVLLLVSLENSGEEPDLDGPQRPSPTPEVFSTTDVKALRPALWRALVAALRKLAKFFLARGSEMSEARVHADTLAAATDVLVVVLTDARTTTRTYSFGPLTPTKVLASGLLITGQTNKILDRLRGIPGVVIYEREDG